jgi:hypothetical protein
LVAADPAWVDAHLEEMFPPGDEPRRQTAFDAYVSFNGVHETAFRILADEYLHAVDTLKDETTQGSKYLGDPAEALVQHLMVALRYGVITLDEGLVDRFYEVAPLERRAQAIDSIGRGLTGDDQLTAEMAARLQGLWERRIEAVTASGHETAADELTGFAWWFASGKLDAAWSLTQLETLLIAGGRLDPDHVVAERLAALMSDHPLSVLGCLERMIETGTRPWFVTGARDEIDAILSAAFALGGEAGDRARDIVNRLVARGHVGYERFTDH